MMELRLLDSLDHESETYDGRELEKKDKDEKKSQPMRRYHALNKWRKCNRTYEPPF